MTDAAPDGQLSGSTTPTRISAAASDGAAMPSNVFRYVLQTGGLHQLFLVLLTIGVFLLEVVPLEVQRRIVNELVKDRDHRIVITLCAVYAGAALVQGGTKLVLNLYRGWIGERATRDLRRRIGVLVNSPSLASSGSEARGIQASVTVAEVDPIGGFVGAALSEPLLQGGVMVSVLAYTIHLNFWLGLTVLVFFLPQLVFVPLMQRAVNRRTGSRVQILRQLYAAIGYLSECRGPRERRHHSRAAAAAVNQRRGRALIRDDRAPLEADRSETVR